jgi:hypothetical protein
MIVVSRLRRDAALRTVPGPKPPGRRGPAPTYGDRRIDLAKRAGQRRGWSTGAFDLYGGKAVKRYKTFLATWRPAGGLIRVVLAVARWTVDVNTVLREVECWSVEDPVQLVQQLSRIKAMSRN